jgi:hypothetical protein
MAVSKRLRYEILKRDKHECQYCGGKAPDVELTVDHVVPSTLGGNDEPPNLVAACKDCNAGKSSVPADAPLVAGVADKALAWAEAMRIVAEERAAARASSEKLYAKFRKEWNSWKDWRGNPEPLPAGWKSSIDQLLNAGLDMADIIEMVDVAMEAKAKDTWRYFCGCCWKQLSKMQQRASEITAGTPSSPPPLQISTRWTQSDLTYLLTLEGIDVEYHGGLFECEDHNDGLCESDTLCQIVSAARTRESLEAFSIGRSRRIRAAEKLNDAAEEAEDYVYG